MAAEHPANFDEVVLTVAASSTAGEGRYRDVQSALVALAGLSSSWGKSNKRCRIKIHGGTYNADQGIVLDKAVEIAAVEDTGPVVLTSCGEWPTIRCICEGVSLHGLSLHQQAVGQSGKPASSLLVEGGNVRVTGCQITSAAGAGIVLAGKTTANVINCVIASCAGDGIRVTETAAPLIQGCQFSENNGFGILCTGESSGKYIDNDIWGNLNAGVFIRGHSFGVFEGNKVRDGRQGGFWVEDHARCIITGNDVFRNAKTGIQVGGQADPVVAHNKVHDGLKLGVVVHDRGHGTFVHNEIYSNAMAGAGITDDSCPVFHSNIVRDGRGGGLVIHKNARGVFEKNIIVGNSHAGVGIKGSARPLLDGNEINDNKGHGIWLQERSGGMLQNNVIERNQRCGVLMTDFASPVMDSNTVRYAHNAGLLARNSTKGVIRGNAFTHNAQGNVVIVDQALMELIANTISHGPLGGIMLRGSTASLLRGNIMNCNNGTNLAVFDSSQPSVDCNVIQNSIGRGLVISDRAGGTYRFNMIKNSGLAGVFVSRNAAPELLANCVCDGKATGILIEDDARGRFSYNIICGNQNEGVAVDGKACPTCECNVVVQGERGGIWLDEDAGGNYRGNVMDSGHKAYCCGAPVKPSKEWRLAERNTNTAPAALAESLADWEEEKRRAAAEDRHVIAIRTPRPGGGDEELGTVNAFSSSQVAGLSPARTCLLVARFLGDAGQFEDAEELINETYSLLGRNGPIPLGPLWRTQQWADMSLHCAELLNKWAAASPEYSKDLMARAAEHAYSAAMYYQGTNFQDPGLQENFASALYWVSLNFATVCRLGGAGPWNAGQALDIAVDAVHTASCMIGADTPLYRVAELYFVQGVINFCAAEALRGGYIDHLGFGPAEAERDLLQHARHMFELAYHRWCEWYGEKHLQTVKAITMLALLGRNGHGPDDGVEWYRKELRIREELQGELHPRTQQARRNYTHIIDVQLSRTVTDFSNDVHRRQQEAKHGPGSRELGSIPVAGDVDAVLHRAYILIARVLGAGDPLEAEGYRSESTGAALPAAQPAPASTPATGSAGSAVPAPAAAPTGVPPPPAPSRAWSATSATFKDMLNTPVPAADPASPGSAAAWSPPAADAAAPAPAAAESASPELPPAPAPAAPAAEADVEADAPAAADAGPAAGNDGARLEACRLELKELRDLVMASDHLIASRGGSEPSGDLSDVSPRGGASAAEAGAAGAMLLLEGEEELGDPGAALRSQLDLIRMGQVSICCAEMLNKWAAASPGYGVDIMTRAAQYSVQAVDIFSRLVQTLLDDSQAAAAAAAAAAAPAGGAPSSGSSAAAAGGGDGGAAAGAAAADGAKAGGLDPQLQRMQDSMSLALYWAGLNFATLCRLGGSEASPEQRSGQLWGPQQAYNVAQAALQQSEALRRNSPAEARAEVVFAKGVLAFCKAESLVAGHLRSLRMDQSALVERKRLQALELFQQAYQMWSGVYGECHLETVKAITMIARLLHMLEGPQAGLAWYRKELIIRERLQGETHPRTQQARRMYTRLLDDKLQATMRESGTSIRRIEPVRAANNIDPNQRDVTELELPDDPDLGSVIPPPR